MTTTPWQAHQLTLEELLLLRFYQVPAHKGALSSVRSHMAGAHYSAVRGRGLEFDESREYQAGDDIRAIDWRITAKTGDTYTKLYKEDKDQPNFIITDMRASMRFGSRGALKSVAAGRIAALLGWYAYKQRDRIGGAILAQDHALYNPIKGGKKGLLSYLNQLPTACDYSAQQDTPPPTLASVLNRAKKVAPAGSTLYIISDFYNLSSDCILQLQSLKKRYTVVLIHIYDPLEKSLPKAGLLPVIQAGQEKAQTHWVDAYSNEQQAAVTNAFNQHIKDLKELSYQINAPLFSICTQSATQEGLRHVFSERDHVA